MSHKKHRTLSAAVSKLLWKHKRWSQRHTSDYSTFLKKNISKYTYCYATKSNSQIYSTPLLKYAQISAPFPTQAIIIECNIKLGNLGRQHLIFNYNSQLIYKKSREKENNYEKNLPCFSTFLVYDQSMAFVYICSNYITNLFFDFICMIIC